MMDKWLWQLNLYFRLRSICMMNSNLGEVANIRALLSEFLQHTLVKCVLSFTTPVKLHNKQLASAYDYQNSSVRNKPVDMLIGEKCSMHICLTVTGTGTKLLSSPRNIFTPVHRPLTGYDMVLVFLR